MPKKLRDSLRKSGTSKGSRNKLYLKYVSDTWLALYSALRISFPIVHRGADPTIPDQRRAWSGLVSMAEWMVKVSMLEHPLLLTKAVKEWSTQAQAIAVGTDRPQRDKKIPELLRFLVGTLKSQATRKNLWTFANVGRSLPPPPSAKTELGQSLRKEATEKWTGILKEKRPPLDPELLDKLRAFVRRRTEQRIRQYEKRHKKPFRGLGPMKLNASGCLERARKKGGVYGRYRETLRQATQRIVKLEQMGPPPVRDRYEALRTKENKARIERTTGAQWPTEPPEGEQRALQENLVAWQRNVEFTASSQALQQAEAREHLRGYVRAAGHKPSEHRANPDDDDVIPDGMTLPMKYLLLPERGCKLRGATMSPAWAVTTGQRINSQWLQLLKLSRIHNYDKAGGDGLPKPILSGIAQNGLREDFVLTSADLSSASDYLHFSASRAVWEGYTEALGDRMPELERELGFVLVAGHMKNVPTAKHGNDEEWLSQAGALMGLPLAWLTLSEIQDFCGHEAMQLCGLTGNPYIICGDDFGAAWTQEAETYYFKLLSDVGLKLNNYKTYSSRTGLVFVEKLFLLGSPTPSLPVQTITTHPDGRKTANLRVWETDPKSPEGIRLQEERTLYAPAGRTLFEWIRLKLVQRRKPLARATYYTRLHLSGRPKLSALIAAKRRGQARQDEKTPLYLSLAGTLTYETERCMEPWRKEAAMAVARCVHKTTFAKWRRSGLPIYWPTELGGWGLPGKQQAPRLFRKAAAVILGGQPKSGKAIIRIRQLTAAPQHLRSYLKDLTAEVKTYPERLSPQAKPTRLSEALADMTAKVLSYHSWDPSYDKSHRERKRWSINQLCRRILTEITHAAQLWKSANPIRPSNLQKLIKRKLDPMVDDAPIHDLLAFTGTQIRTTEYLVEHLLPTGAEDRLVRRPEEGKIAHDPDGPPQGESKGPSDEEREVLYGQEDTSPPITPQSGVHDEEEAARALQALQAVLPPNTMRGNLDQVTLSTTQLGGNLLEFDKQEQEILEMRERLSRTSRYLQKLNRQKAMTVALRRKLSRGHARQERLLESVRQLQVSHQERQRDFEMQISGEPTTLEWNEYRNVTHDALDRVDSYCNQYLPGVSLGTGTVERERTDGPNSG
jgi:hypothetical protein